MDFQRLKLPNPRGVIDYNGKFVSANQQHQPIAHYSFREQSNTKNSFSLNHSLKLQNVKKQAFLFKWGSIDSETLS